MSLPHDYMGEQAPIQRAFFANTKFAVVGASTNKEKYGTKILRWYLDRQKNVVPVHPKEAELEGVKTLPALASLPDPKTTSVSVITPPPVTLNLLKEAKGLDIPTLWLQPGAENDEVRAYIEEAGLKDRVVLGGPCVLVLGDRLLADVASKSNL